MLTKRHIFILLVITSLISACKKEDSEFGGSYSLIFYPRVCTHIIVSAAQFQQKDESVNSKPFIITSAETVNGEQVQSKDFILRVQTGADDLKMLQYDFPDRDPKDYYWMYQDELKKTYNHLAENIISLEKQLERDYRDYVTIRSSSNSYYNALLNWDYRVTGIKDLKISALSPLFGVAAGESLNRFFSIYEFEPKQVISSQSKNLLWGYKDKSELNKIEQWLSMKPMAPPQILLRLNAVPQEAPTEVQFVTTLETNDGLLLSDTCKVYLK